MKKLKKAMLVFCLGLGFAAFAPSETLANELRITSGIEQTWELNDSEQTILYDFLHNFTDRESLEFYGFEEFLFALSELENIEVTFDESRTFTGVAPVGSIIKVNIFTVEDGEILNIGDISNIVGSSGVFSADIPLAEASNIIFITMTDEDGFVVMLTTIKRLAIEIRQELETRRPNLPGRANRTSRTSGTSVNQGVIF